MEIVQNVLSTNDINDLIGHGLGVFMLGWGLPHLFKVVKKLGEIM